MVGNKEAPFASKNTVNKGHQLIVHDNDVLSGRGVNIAQHTGNERFRTLVISRKDETYLTAYSTTEKRAVALGIIEHIQNLNPPGRFLKREGRGHASRGLSGPWEELTERERMKKTCQALRDCNRGDRMGYATGVHPPDDVLRYSAERNSCGLTGKQQIEMAAAVTTNSGTAEDAASLKYYSEKKNISSHYRIPNLCFESDFPDSFDMRMTPMQPGTNMDKNVNANLDSNSIMNTYNNSMMNTNLQMNVNTNMNMNVNTKMTMRSLDNYQRTDKIINYKSGNSSINLSVPFLVRAHTAQANHETTDPTRLLPTSIQHSRDWRSNQAFQGKASSRRNSEYECDTFNTHSLATGRDLSTNQMKNESHVLSNNTGSNMIKTMIENMNQHCIDSYSQNWTISSSGTSFYVHPGLNNINMVRPNGEMLVMDESSQGTQFFNTPNTNINGSILGNASLNAVMNPRSNLSMSMSQSMKTPIQVNGNTPGNVFTNGSASSLMNNMNHNSITNENRSMLVPLNSNCKASYNRNSSQFPENQISPTTLLHGDTYDANLQYNLNGNHDDKVLQLTRSIQNRAANIGNTIEGHAMNQEGSPYNQNTCYGRNTSPLV